MFELKIFLILSVVVGTIYGAYKIPQFMGKKKLGIILSLIVSLIILTPFFGYVFEDYLFTKSDAKEYFSDNDLMIKGEIELKSNKIIGLMDYYQEFTIEVTDSDKSYLIDQILASDVLIDEPIDMFDIRSGKPRHSTSNQIYKVAYETKHEFKYQSYQLRQKGYTPRWDMISIPKSGNIISCTRIED